MARIDITASPHNAVGDGLTNDTSAFVSAISAASEGDCVVIPRGTYETDTIEVPDNKSLTFLGEGPQASVVRARSNNIDVFHSDRGTAVAEDRFETQHNYHGFSVVLRTNATDTAPSFNRCTVGGLPVGCAAFAYERKDLPTSTTNGNDQAWPNTFGSITNVIVQDNLRNTGGQGLGTNSCAIYIEGSAYGWTFDRHWYHDVDHGIVITAPFIRRCSVNASTDRLTYSVDASQAYPANAEIMVLQHSGAGTLSGGISRDTEYFVRSPATGNLQISTSAGGAAVNITSAGTAPAYVAGRDNYGGGAISPDGVSIDRITQYGGKTHISIINPEGLEIGRTDSYQISGHIIELRDYPASSRPAPLSCLVRMVYSESPQTTNLISSNQTRDPLVYISGECITIHNLQVRGDDGASDTRPIVHIAGRCNRVDNVYVKSNFSQAQADIWVSGDGCKVFGLSHDGGDVYNSGSNNTIEIHRDTSGAPLHTVTSGTP